MNKRTKKACVSCCSKASGLLVPAENGPPPHGLSSPQGSVFWDDGPEKWIAWVRVGDFFVECGWGTFISHAMGTYNAAVGIVYPGKPQRFEHAETRHVPNTPIFTEHFLAAVALAKKLSAKGPSRKPAKEGWVYYAQSLDGGPIKIGWTNNVKARLASLNTSSPQRIVILAAEPGDRATEAAMHRRFDAARKNGEWFDPVDDLLSHVRLVMRAAS